MVPGFWDVSQRQRIVSPHSVTLEQTAVETIKLAGIYVLNTVVTLSCRAEVCYTVPCVFIYLIHTAAYHRPVLLLTYSTVHSPS